MNWFLERFGATLLVFTMVLGGLLLLPSNVESSSAPAEVSAGGFATGPVDDPFATAAPAAPQAPAPDGMAAAAPQAPGAAVAPSTGGAAPSASTPSAAAGAPRTATPAAQAGATQAAPAAGAPAATAAAGPELVWGQGPNCREDGRQHGISAYMPPCVTWNGTDNGGATARGVTADEIIMVHWRAQSDPGTEAILAGARLADTKDQVSASMDALVRYWNAHAELYGRQVKIVTVDASGPSTSEEAMRADALKITQEIGAFAVVEGSGGIPLVLARELAQRGTICICANSRTSQTYTEVPPLIFNDYPTADEYAAHAAEYIGKKLEGGRTAIYAGDDQTVGQVFTSSVRKYGIVYMNGRNGTVDPDRVRARDVMVRELGKWGIGSDRIVDIGYLYDPGRNQADMTNMIARLKSEGVTTVIPFWDPLTPIILTQEASRQAYYPEWFNIGLGLSDTTTAARLYDQSQWQNAFGITPLWVTWETVENSIGYREFHHGCPECAPGDEGNLINIYREPMENLFIGIHMAGPRLTPQTFVEGMYAYPPTGGTAAMPLQYYTRNFPGEIKDFAEFWYDVNETGPDERGDIGPGMIWKTNNGARYALGEWTTDESLAFVKENVLAVSDDPPGPTDHPHDADGHSH